MAEQLTLIREEESGFRLDAHTREVGRKGVAEARRVLDELMQARADREAAAA